MHFDGGSTVYGKDYGSMSHRLDTVTRDLDTVEVTLYCGIR